jgi:hypothetical protein
MLRFALALLLFPSTAMAQATATLSPTGITRTGDQVRVGLTLSTQTDQTLLLTRATLIDNSGRATEMSGDPIGIHADVRGSCVLGTLILANSPQRVTIPFRASTSEPPFKVKVELETPDPSPGSGCRTIELSADGLQRP